MTSESKTSLNGVLEIRLFGCEGLRPPKLLELITSISPYVKIQLGDFEWKSHVVHNGHHSPDFSSTDPKHLDGQNIKNVVSIPVEHLDHKTALSFKVKHYTGHSIIKDSLLGMFSMDLGTAVRHVGKHTLQLMDIDMKGDEGKIHVEFQWKDVEGNVVKIDEKDRIMNIAQQMIQKNNQIAESHAK